jgi:hypothetical protein
MPRPRKQAKPGEHEIRIDRRVAGWAVVVRHVRTRRLAERHEVTTYLEATDKRTELREHYPDGRAGSASQDNVVVTVRMPETLRDRIVEMAAAMELSEAAVVRLALPHGLDFVEKPQQVAR